MPRTFYIHLETMLSMLGAMPARKSGESDEAYGHRKSSKATWVERTYGLQAYQGAGRARVYRETDVFDLAQRIVKPLAA